MGRQIPFQCFPPRERADCSIRAISSATGASYDSVYAAAARLGRRPRARFKTTILALRIGMVPVKFKSRTVGKLLDELSSGRYVILITKHAFGVADGAVYDEFEPKLRSRAVKSLDRDLPLR